MDFHMLRNRIFGWGDKKETEASPRKASSGEVPIPTIVTRQIQAITGGVSYMPLLRKQLGFGIADNIEDIKQAYPALVRILFNVAQEMLDGRFGTHLQEHAKAESELFQERSMVWSLVLIAMAKNDELSRSELFGKDANLVSLETLKDLPPSEIERLLLYPINELPENLRKIKLHLIALTKNIIIPLDHQNALVWLFQQYIENLLHPSHVMVNIAMEMERQEPTLGSTIRAVMRVKRPTERSKSLSNIVQTLAHEKHSDRALTIVRSLKLAEKSDTMNSILDTLFKNDKSPKNGPDANWFEKATAEALSLPYREEQDRMLQRLAAAASRYGDATTAFDTANKISDPETRAYALSSSIQGLLTAGRRQAALQLLPTITDVGAKEDAIGYIIKDLNQRYGYDGVVTFIDSLPNPSEQRHAAKVLVSLLVPAHDSQHIGVLKERYVFS